MTTLTGVIPALTTPFRDDLSLDLPGFARLVEVVISDGVDGLLVSGCTGEAWALSDEERRQIFRTAVVTARGRVPVVAGCGHMMAAGSVALARDAAEAGCDAALIQPPWYILPGLEEVMDHFAAVLRDTPLPVVIYNIPRRTGINLTPDMCDRLADHPKVVAFKESSKDFLLLQDIIRAVGDRAKVFAGYASCDAGHGPPLRQLLQGRDHGRPGAGAGVADAYGHDDQGLLRHRHLPRRREGGA